MAQTAASKHPLQNQSDQKQPEQLLRRGERSLMEPWRHPSMMEGWTDGWRGGSDAHHPSHPSSCVELGQLVGKVKVQDLLRESSQVEGGAEPV